MNKIKYEYDTVDTESLTSTKEQGRKVMTSHKSDVWSTPQWLFDVVNEEFKFTLDPATNGSNSLCPKFFTEIEDGITQNWQNEIIWCNPPYSKNKEWTKKMASGEAISVVGLIPARTGAKYFHEFVFNKASEILFFNSRLKFSNAKSSAPFDSVLILWGQGSLQFLQPRYGQLFNLKNRRALINDPR